MSNRARAILIVVGVLLLAIGAVILIRPGLGVLVLAYLIAFGLIIIGLERLVMGILG